MCVEKTHHLISYSADVSKFRCWVAVLHRSVRWSSVQAACHRRHHRTVVVQYDCIAGVWRGEGAMVMGKQVTHTVT